MKKTITIIAGIIVILFLLSRGQVINAMVYFALTGAIPGTQFSLPYWAVMAFYCAVIALIMTDVIDSLLRTVQRSRNIKTRNARLPRRRYSTSSTLHSA